MKLEHIFLVTKGWKNIYFLSKKTGKTPFYAQKVWFLVSVVTETRKKSFLIYVVFLVKSSYYNLSYKTSLCGNILKVPNWFINTYCISKYQQLIVIQAHNTYLYVLHIFIQTNLYIFQIIINMCTHINMNICTKKQTQIYKYVLGYKHKETHRKQTN